MTAYDNSSFLMGSLSRLMFGKYFVHYYMFFSSSLDEESVDLREPPEELKDAVEEQFLLYDIEPTRIELRSAGVGDSGSKPCLRVTLSLREQTEDVPIKLIAKLDKAARAAISSVDVSEL